MLSPTPDQWPRMVDAETESREKLLLGSASRIMKAGGIQKHLFKAFVYDI